ncbi:unnamed protein product, partial [Closterium sp. NIES-54]
MKDTGQDEAGTTGQRFVATAGFVSIEAASVMQQALRLWSMMSPVEIERLMTSLQDTALILFVYHDPVHLWTLAGLELMESLEKLAERVAAMGMKCEETRLHGLAFYFNELRHPATQFPAFRLQPGEQESLMCYMREQVERVEELRQCMERINTVRSSIKKMQGLVSQSSASSNLLAELESVSEDYELDDNDPPQPSSSSKASSNTRSSGSGSSSSSSGSGNSSLLREMSDSFDDAVLGQLGMARTNLPCDLPGGEEIFRLMTRLTELQARTLWAVELDHVVRILVLAIFMIRDRVLSVFGIDAHSDESVSENETLGSAGLALRYARIILLAEKLMKYPFMAAGGTTRDELFGMLTNDMRTILAGRLVPVMKEDSSAEPPPAEPRLGGGGRARRRRGGSTDPAPPDDPTT